MSSNHKNILIVEDDLVDVMTIKRAFKQIGIVNELHIESNGEEALRYLNEINELPGLIILDLNMPKMGGIEFLREIRKDEKLKNISVFVMTTSNEDKDKVDAYNLNVAGYILKPLSMERFIEAVSTLNNYWKLCEFPDK